MIDENKKIDEEINSVQKEIAKYKGQMTTEEDSKAKKDMRNRVSIWELWFTYI